jgi:hypothetical protein
MSQRDLTNKTRWTRKMLMQGKRMIERGKRDIY